MKLDIKPVTKVIDKDLKAVAVKGMKAELVDMGRKEHRHEHGSTNKERKKAKEGAKNRWSSRDERSEASVSSEEVKQPSDSSTSKDSRSCKACEKASVPPRR